MPAPIIAALALAIRNIVTLLCDRVQKIARQHVLLILYGHYYAAILLYSATTTTTTTTVAAAAACCRFLQDGCPRGYRNVGWDNHYHRDGNLVGCDGHGTGHARGWQSVAMDPTLCENGNRPW